MLEMVWFVLPTSNLMKSSLAISASKAKERGFRDILVDLGGYDFQEGAVVTGNLLVGDSCAGQRTILTIMKMTKWLEFGFIKVTQLS